MKTQQESENPIKRQNNQKLSAQLYMSATIFAVVLIGSSYIIDLLFSKKSGSTQDSTAVSSILSGLGILIVKYSFIFISAGIVLKHGEVTGLPSALIGSILISQGCTFANISGSLSGISGIFGSILTGYIALISVKLCRMITIKYSKTNFKQIRYLLPIPITCLGVLSINSIGALLNSVSTFLVKNLADSRTILLPVIIGIFTVIDGGGPLSLCAYIFGSTSIIADEPQVMAAVIGAGMIPSLSIALFAYVYKERLESFEAKGAYLGIFPALLGLPQLSYLFYITRKLKFVLPCMIGSGITALLSVMLGCSTTATKKGFLDFTSFQKPLYLIVCIIFGAFVTTVLLSFTIKSAHNEAIEKAQTKNNKKETKPNTAQA